MSVSTLEAAQKGIGLVLIFILLYCAYLALRVLLRASQARGPSLVRLTKGLFVRWPLLWIVLVGGVGLAAAYVIDIQLQGARRDEAMFNKPPALRGEASTALDAQQSDRGIKVEPANPAASWTWVCPPPCRR